MKIAYFGFDLFYDCLEQIVDSGNKILKIFTCKVDGVYESSNKVYAFAKKHNIEIIDKKVDEKDIIYLLDNGCNLFFSAGYYFKIPIVDRLTGVNIHPALLPKGRGPWPQPLTILKGLEETGITLHKLSDKFDEGDIVLQKSFAVEKNDNLETITDKYAYYAKNITKELFCDFEKLMRNSVPQTKGEYWPEPSDADMTFSALDNSEKIDSVLRAFYGYKCTMIYDGSKIFIKKGKYISDDSVSCVKSNAFKVNSGYVVVIEYA